MRTVVATVLECSSVLKNLIMCKCQSIWKCRVCSTPSVIFTQTGVQYLKLIFQLKQVRTHTHTHREREREREREKTIMFNELREKLSQV